MLLWRNYVAGSNKTYLSRCRVAQYFCSSLRKFDFTGEIFVKSRTRKSVQWELRWYRRTDGRDTASWHFIYSSYFLFSCPWALTGTIFRTYLNEKSAQTILRFKLALFATYANGAYKRLTENCIGSIDAVIYYERRTDWILRYVVIENMNENYKTEKETDVAYREVFINAS